jgi:Zn-dependent protease with chaperone function
MGYLWVILNGPIWVGLRPAMQMFSFLIIDDCWNLLLLIGYILWFMWQSYQLNRQASISLGGFGSYLMQYGYVWLFTLNIVIYMRIDYYYLPLITRHFSEFNRSIIEMITFLVFLLLQLGVLYVRQLRMVEAGPELRAMVAEVAACFKLKIKNVRVWKLDRINNAFSTGLFFRGIFLTETLVKSSSLEDLKMILGHECAHFKCHHLEIRILVIGALIYLGSTLMEDYPDLNGLFYFGFALAAILIYQAIARRQELKADRLAAKMLGGKDKMADALTRVLGLNVSPSKFGWVMGLLLGHPDLETRVKCLRG